MYSAHFPGMEFPHRNRTSNPRRSRPALLALAVVAGASACSGPPEAALTVGPASYTADQLLGLSETRIASLAELTAFGLSVADSTTAALGQPLVDEWLDDRRIAILAAELTLERHGVDDDVLEAHYLRNPRWELVVRHILFFSERWRAPQHRAEAEAKARRAMDALRAGADFASTAAELSEEPGAEGRQGLLTPGREGSWVPEFWAAALALEPGEISPVTETQYGYHILRLEDRRVVPFSEARSTVARAIADEIDDPEAVLTEWMAGETAAPEDGRARALAEAARRGIEVPEGERAELSRAWDDVVYRLSTSLGFRYGVSVEAVQAAALSALANAAQGAGLARTELSSYRHLLEARYPIRGSGTAAGMQP